MNVDDEKPKVLKFEPKLPQPTEEECLAKARSLMRLADETTDVDRKAKLLSEAGDWLRRATQARPRD